MWHKLYTDLKLQLIIEISTHCNAKCMQCSRTNIEGLGLHPQAPRPSHMSLENFKKFFTPADLRHLYNIHFSGTYGDPLMNPEIYEIIKYCCENMVDGWGTVSIATNGSIRDEDFWWELGILCGKKLKVTFDIDGINQEMHEKYRRGTNLNKILRNMETLSLTKARIKTFTVLFKHNEDYIEEIKKICKDHGATEHEIIQSTRFFYGPVLNFINEKGEEETLEQAGSNSHQDFVDFNRTTIRRLRDHRTLKSYSNLVKNFDNPPEISCAFFNSKSLHITVEGIVKPCCYWKAIPMEYSASNMQATGGANNVYKQFIGDISKYSLHNFSLSEILNSKLYNNDILESFTDPDKLPRICLFQCRKKI